jgi:hypothetical protein
LVKHFSSCLISILHKNKFVKHFFYSAKIIILNTDDGESTMRAVKNHDWVYNKL